MVYIGFFGFGKCVWIWGWVFGGKDENEEVGIYCVCNWLFVCFFLLEFIELLLYNK